MEDYYPKKYLTVELVKEIIINLELDVSYRIEDDLPDGIDVHFSKSSIYFSEYAEGEISVYFLSSETGLDKDLTLTEVLSIVVPDIDLSKECLIDRYLPYASKIKVENQIRNTFHLLVKYMSDFIKTGDYSWVEEYKKKST